MQDPVIEIPMFAFEESLAIEALFEQGGIRYEKSVVHLGVDPAGGHHAYSFLVPEEQFQSAIALLKECFDLRTGKGPAFGVCPACGAQLSGYQRCPDCGLHLAGDYTGLKSGHPFVMFLKREGLL